MPRTSMLSGLQDGQGLTPRMASPVVIRQSRQFSYERKVFRLVPCPHNCGSDVAKRTKRHDKLRHRFIVGHRPNVIQTVLRSTPNCFAVSRDLSCLLGTSLTPLSPWSVKFTSMMYCGIDSSHYVATAVAAPAINLTRCRTADERSCRQ